MTGVSPVELRPAFGPRQDFRRNVTRLTSETAVAARLVAASPSHAA